MPSMETAGGLDRSFWTGLACKLQLCKRHLARDGCSCHPPTCHPGLLLCNTHLQASEAIYKRKTAQAGGGRGSHAQRAASAADSRFQADKLSHATGCKSITLVVVIKGAPPPLPGTCAAPVFKQRPGRIRKMQHHIIKGASNMPPGAAQRLRERQAGAPPAGRLAPAGRRRSQAARLQAPNRSRLRQTARAAPLSRAAAARVCA